MKPLFYLIFFVGIIVGCKSSSNSLSKETISQKVSVLLESKHFNIECSQMYPTNTSSLQAIANAGLIAPGNSVGQINITGSNNYFKIIGDSISVNLPFYGEQQLGGLAYNRNDVGFSFQGIPKEFSESKNIKKNIRILNYTFPNGAESCKAQIRIYSQGSAEINITSSHRSSIRYRGNIKSISNDLRILANATHK